MTIPAGLSAGVAEVDITPPIGMTLCGFDSRTGPSTGILDSLLARVLVLDDGSSRVALVTADLVCFADDLVACIRREVEALTGLPASHLMLNASHTHSGPTVMTFRAMGCRDAVYEGQLAGGIARAVEQAIATLRPVQCRHGRAPVDIGCNRRVLRAGMAIFGEARDRPSAPWVDVVCFEAVGGEPLALLFTTAVHPVNLRGSLISADYPGAAVRALRERWPDAMALFAQGCSGNINCSPLDGSYKTSLAIGRRLADAVTVALQSARLLHVGRLQVAREHMELPLQLPSVPEAEAALAEAIQNYANAEADPAVNGFLLQQRYAGMVAWARDYLAAAQQGGHPEQPFDIQLIACGELAILGYPAEVFVEHQLALDATSPFPVTLPFGCTNGCIGYIPTAEEFAHGGYEVEAAFRYYGTLMVEPDSEQRIAAAARALLAACH